MKRPGAASGLGILAASAALALAHAASAGGPIDGIWVDDLDAQANPDHADVYLVRDGVYRCDSCRPPRRYPADGRLRPVGDDPGVEESAAAAGPRTLVTRIASPGKTREVTITVSDDDRSATYVAIDRGAELPGPLRTRYLARRSAPAPPGAHPVSGAWLAVRYLEVPQAYRTVELHETGQGLTRLSPTRGHYTAVYGGPPAPIQGLAGAFEAQVTKLPAGAVVETILRDGKPIMTRTYQLSADGRSLQTTATNAAGETFRIIAHRKPPSAP